MLEIYLLFKEFEPIRKMSPVEDEARPKDTQI